MYQSEWTNQPVLHIFPHWNWDPGKIVDLWAYFSQADEVELFLNGKSLGIRKKTDGEMHVMWRVPFSPGTLTAISRKNGKTVLRKEVRTTGAPVRLVLSVDKSLLKADVTDLSFVTVKVVDKDGRMVPDADHLVSFSISGAGVIAATDNGFQADLTPFSSRQRKLWKGMGLAIIRSSEKEGNITLRVTAEGLESATLTLKTRK
jgi:beta-galactosidase